jgi:DNA invertase Pin-like site-specific DNA recombinase
MRAAIYCRVSTDGQTIENQRLRLAEVAKFHGWSIVAEYADVGISGAKGRKDRPGLDQALKAGDRHQYDVLLAWSLDRLGRSVVDLIKTANALRAAGRNLYLDRERIDTTTDAGEMMFVVLAALGQFERRQIVARVNAGIARAKAAGVHCGRPRLDAAKEAAVRDILARGASIAKAAAEAGVSVGAAHKIKAGMAAE